jgi:hypothetical protein
MTSLPSLAPHLRQTLALFGARVAIVLGVGSALIPTSALAELQVGGNPKAVTIDAQNSSIKEILDALGKTFDVHVQSTANLEKQITGTYEGSLPKVLKRILEGYNVIMKTSKDGIEITVLGTRNASGTAGVSPTVPPASTVANTVAQAAPVSPASTPAAPPSLAGKDTETPMLSASANASSPLIVLAEGPSPPVPSGGSAPNAFPQAQPSSVAPPTPAAGSAPGAFPVGKPTTSLPPAPVGSAAMNTPGPQPTATGTAAPPVAK